MGVATTPAPKGLGPQNSTKTLAHVGVLLAHLLSQNRVPKVSDPGPPHLHNGPLISAREKLAVCDVTNLPYMDIN